jgi:hypothetical protein
VAVHRQFLTQLSSFENEARNAARYVYADLAIQHAASKSERLLDRLNDTPTFWLSVLAAFQTAAYISLGRIFDNKSRYNINRLISTAELNIALFTRAALAERKREGQATDPPWLTSYLDDAYYPNSSDFSRLKKKVAEHRLLYEKAVKPARDRYIAHRVEHGHEEMASLFGRGKIKDLWRLTMFLQQLHTVLWELFHNGKKPRFRRMRYSVAEMFRRPPVGDTAHEGIVRETQQLMQLLKDGGLGTLPGTNLES